MSPDCSPEVLKEGLSRARMPERRGWSEFSSTSFRYTNAQRQTSKRRIPSSTGRSPTGGLGSSFLTQSNAFYVGRALFRSIEFRPIGRRELGNEAARASILPVSGSRTALRWLNIYPAIDPRRLHRFFVGQHLRRRIMPPGMISCLLNGMIILLKDRMSRAFSSEVDTGSREENASKQEIEPRSDSIGTEKALACRGHRLRRSRWMVVARSPPCIGTRGVDLGGCLQFGRKRFFRFEQTLIAPGLSQKLLAFRARLIFFCRLKFADDDLVQLFDGPMRYGFPAHGPIETLILVLDQSTFVPYFYGCDQCFSRVRSFGITNWLARRMGGANGSRECAPDDKLRDTHRLHLKR
jgi:hypothetical protein